MIQYMKLSHEILINDYLPCHSTLQSLIQCPLRRPIRSQINRGKAVHAKYLCRYLSKVYRNSTALAPLKQSQLVSRASAPVGRRRQTRVAPILRWCYSNCLSLVSSRLAASPRSDSPEVSVGHAAAITHFAYYITTNMAWQNGPRTRHTTLVMTRGFPH